VDHIQKIGNRGDNIRYIGAVTEQASPNSELEMHAEYDEFEIYQFLEGDLFFACEGKRFPVESGTIIMICDCVLHRPVLTKPCCYRRNRILFRKDVFFRYDSRDLTLYNRLRQQRMILLTPKAVAETGADVLFGDIVKNLMLHTPYGNYCALINLLSLLIKAEQSYTQSLYTSDRNCSQQAMQILQFIDTHLSEELSYATIAKHFFLSEKSLYKYFKKETGFTLGYYITQRKLVKAQSVMNAGGTAFDAAQAAGFKDYSVFYRSFLKETGISPAAYIKRVRKNGHI